MLSVGEAHQVQLIDPSTSYGKGSTETSSTQEIKQSKKVALQHESHVLRTTRFLNAAIFTIAPQNAMGQMKYYLLHIRSDEIRRKDYGGGKTSRKVLQKKAKQPPT